MQSYIKTVGRIIRLMCIVFGLATLAMVGFSTVDCTAGMNWGWDCQSRWIALPILAICCVIYFGSKIIQRIVSGTVG